METKKNFFNYIKNSYSNTTNFANFKIFKVFYCLALLLTLLFIPTVNAQADDTLYYDTTLPQEVLKDFYNDYADYMKYYPNFIVRKIKFSSYEFYIATFFNPKNLYIKQGDGVDRRDEDKLYWSSIEHDWSNDFIHLTYMPEDDNYDFYYMPDAYDFPYEELTSTKEYFTDFDFIYNGEVVLKKNNIPIEPPVEETPIVGNESYIIINGEKVNVNYAIVQYLMRIEFIITLLFTVTVVLFIINKFWAWCRRLFTTSIR